jgi:hypothetical protein
MQAALVNEHVHAIGTQMTSDNSEIELLRKALKLQAVLLAVTFELLLRNGTLEREEVAAEFQRRTSQSQTEEEAALLAILQGDFLRPN